MNGSFLLLPQESPRTSVNEQIDFNAANEKDEVDENENKDKKEKKIKKIKKVKKEKKDNKEKKKGELFKDKFIQLNEDYFGMYFDDNGKVHYIKRYTWKNNNKVQVQVVTYGATVTSIKLPDSKGVADDVLLGFDDLQSYVYHDNLKIGGIIGRVSNTVELGTFAIDGRQFWISKNDGRDHKDGGFTGFDKKIWSSYVNGTKVIMSYTSPNAEEGYPGDLFVRITFELTKENEFKVSMEALSTRPTIVDLSHFLYINLGGHWSGDTELKKHIVTINANCFTLKDDFDGYPTGDILNVIFSKFDYQNPKLLKNELTSSEGIDQNLCVNRSKGQDLCFVARVIHPPSARIIEIYSNQWGVNFSTAAHFGHGELELFHVTEICPEKYNGSISHQLDLIKKLYEHMQSISLITFDYDFCELRELIRKFNSKPSSALLTYSNSQSSGSSFTTTTSEMKTKRSDIQLTPKQMRYLEEIYSVVGTIKSETNYSELENVLKDIISQAEIIPEEEEEEEDETKITDVKTFPTSDDGTFTIPEGTQISPSEQNSVFQLSYTKASSRQRTPNAVLPIQKDGRIHGKGDTIYKTNCCFSLKTQNYPCAIHHPNFPSSVLRPGETYTHNIVYKFMLKNGNCRNWIKRNFPDDKYGKK